MRLCLVFDMLITVAVVGSAAWGDDWAKMEPIEPRGHVCHRTTGFPGMVAEIA